MKFIDDTFDSGKYNKRVAAIVAPIVIAAWIYASLKDTFSATLLFSILLAVLLSGKVDNPVFKISALALVMSLPFVGFNPFYLVILTAAGILDEISDSVERQKYGFILKHRPWMKFAVLGLCLFYGYSLRYFLAILVLDFAYDLVGLVPSLCTNSRICTTLLGLLREKELGEK